MACEPMAARTAATPNRPRAQSPYHGPRVRGGASPADHDVWVDLGLGAEHAGNFGREHVVRRTRHSRLLEYSANSGGLGEAGKGKPPVI